MVDVGFLLIGSRSWSTQNIKYTFSSDFLSRTDVNIPDINNDITGKITSSTIDTGNSLGGDAATLWSNVADITLESTNTVNDADMAILKANVIDPPGKNNVGYASLAPTSASSSTTASAVFIEDGQPLWVYLHELGHALGLSHPNDDVEDPDYNRDVTIMSKRDGDHVIGGLVNRQAKTPMLYDIAAIQSLYGANFSYKGEANTSHTFDGSKVARTIWDGGGAGDVLDASNQTTDVTLDLREGFDKDGKQYVTKVGNERVFNAYHANIENAKGGSGNDFIYGNDKQAESGQYAAFNGNNKLEGGAGNDTIHGGTGDNIIDGGGDIDTASYLDSTIDTKVKIIEEETVPSTATSGADVIVNIEKIQGSDHSDTMDIKLLADSLIEEIDTGADDDVINVYAPGSTSLPNLVIRMGDGDDIIAGDPNNLMVFYDPKNDIPVGATVYGGANDDIFTILPISNNDDGLPAENIVEVYTIMDAQPGDRLKIGWDYTVNHGIASGSLTELSDGTWNLNSFGSFLDFKFDGDDLIVYSLNYTDMSVRIKDFVSGDLGITLNGPPNNTSDADDTINGDSSVNIIDAGYGYDTISAGGGDDTINAGHGDDFITGGTGADTINGGGGNDTASYSGSSAAVNVNINSSNAQSGGDAAGDILYHIENIIGSDYNDTITGNYFNNFLIGGAGADAIDGGDGIDTISYASSAVVVKVNLETANLEWGAYGDSVVNVENVVGSAFGDDLTAIDTGSTINGGDGNDTINGGDGDDILYGDNGDDTFYAGDGDDTIYGGAGADFIYSQGGNNILIGGAGADGFNGFSGVATADYTASGAAVNINLLTNVNTGGDAQGDLLYGVPNIIGSYLNDTIIGDNFSNNLYGGGGDDLLMGIGYGGNHMDGGDDFDTVSYANSDVVKIDLGITTSQDWAASGDTIVNVEKLIGSDFGDDLTAAASGSTISGGAGWDTISGAAGNDILHGDAENDTIYGNDGNDLIYGDAGDDTLWGQAGNNILTGGVGADTIMGFGGTSAASYATSAAAVNVNIDTNTHSGGDAQGDYLGGITNLIGSAFADTLVGNYLDNTITGGAGADTIDGGTGIDLVSYATSGAAVNVNLALTTSQSGGDAAGDLLSNIENLTGSEFNDTLLGSSIANIIFGGTGKDTMTGGAGADVFKYSSITDSYTFSGLRDIITDFVNGTDQIDLGDFAGSFTFKGTGAFTHTAPEVNYAQVSGNTIISIDADGSGAADFQIELVGLHTMTASDFLL